MRIDKIYSNGNLSVRSYNVCKDNGIQNISDLKEFYEIRKSFRFLRNCGAKSNQELLELCDEFNQNAPIEGYDIFDNKQIEIIDKYINEKFLLLSNRNKNAIKKYFRKPLAYKVFQEIKIFSQNLNALENIGLKSSKELNKYFLDIFNFCEGIKKSSNSISPFLTKENTIVNTIKSLSRPQRQVINHFIKITTSNLKVRGQNAIKYYLGKTSPKLNDFVIKFFNTDYFEVSKLEKVGKNTIPEIEAYLNIIRFLFMVSNSTFLYFW